MRTVLSFALILLGIGNLGRGQTAEPLTHPKLVPTLWVQTAPEWRAICLETYRSATAWLDRALKDKKWTAATEQTGRYRKLPPAIVLDIDETVLDNSPGQARQVRTGTGFVSKDWAQWVFEEKAGAIPGAVEFCKYAASRKVRVVFITNRDADQKKATIANLSKLGFPVSAETVMCRGEKPEWTSEKASRRKEVAERYRIVMLFGDDLGDFIPGARTTLTERLAKAQERDANWGRKWFVLPNPGYGSWEEAVYAPARPASGTERVELQVKRLDTRTQ